MLAPIWGCYHVESSLSESLRDLLLFMIFIKAISWDFLDLRNTALAFNQTAALSLASFMTSNLARNRSQLNNLV